MRISIGIILITLLASACGTDEDQTSPAPTEDENQAIADAEEATSEVTEDETSDIVEDETLEMGDESNPDTPRGVVIVDGVSYTITEVQKCEPYADDVVDRELELQGFGEHDGERLQIDVYIETLAGIPYNDVSWMGPEGVYGGPDDANIMLDAAGTSVRGNAVIYDALTLESTVTIEFDLEVPEETYACR